MYRRIVSFSCCCFCIFFFLGCTTDNSNSAQAKVISFEYFFRGFTPLVDDSDIALFADSESVIMITSKEEWETYCQNYCPFVGKHSPPDFSTENIIVIHQLYGSSPSATSSIEIEKITIDNEIISIQYDDTSFERTVFAMNSNGIAHCFICIVKVDRSCMDP